MLTQKVAIYVPTTAPDHKVKSVLKVVKQRFAKDFGGYTCYKATGGWVDDTGLLIEEDVFVVQSFCTAEALKGAFLPLLAGVVCHHLDQKCLALEVNGTLNLVEPLVI